MDYTGNIGDFAVKVLERQREFLEKCLINPNIVHHANVISNDAQSQDKQDILLAASRLLPRGMLWIGSCGEGIISANIVVVPNRRKFRKMWLDMYSEKAPSIGKTWMNGI